LLCSSDAMGTLLVDRPSGLPGPEGEGRGDPPGRR
jgi:hypothetical protein